MGGDRLPGWVYPRVCGGSTPPPAIAVPPEGLSPRVRGKRVSVRRLGNMGRSIPACAGEAVGAALPAGAVWVYPRVCGGSSSGRRPGGTFPGLSPRVRGKQ